MSLPYVIFCFFYGFCTHKPITSQVNKIYSQFYEKLKIAQELANTINQPLLLYQSLKYFSKIPRVAEITKLAFEKAKQVLEMNITPAGFTACSVDHDNDENSNYRSIWARDSSITFLWSLSLNDSKFIECGKQSIRTILSHQSEDGHLPNYVEIADSRPEYGGIGNIAGIDGPMWVVIAVSTYVKYSNDIEFGNEALPKLRKTMMWLSAHDSNNNGLIEIPESSDWTDLFPRSYNALYDQVLWYRANLTFSELLEMLGEPWERYKQKAEKTKTMINDLFWPDFTIPRFKEIMFSDVQFSLGRTRYLISQITPFSFSWRCDVYGNLLAYLYGILNEDQATKVKKFFHQVGADEPYPIKVLYPVISPGDKDWREYFVVNLQNLPHHYHNGGIWLFVGGLWVSYLAKLGDKAYAENSLKKLAELCKDGIDHEWEFNEWAHGLTGRPMGKAFQAWSAASYIAAYNFVNNGVAPII